MAVRLKKGEKLQKAENVEKTTVRNHLKFDCLKVSPLSSKSEKFATLESL
jgi:hypothetical protein